MKKYQRQNEEFNFFDFVIGMGVCARPHLYLILS